MTELIISDISSIDSVAQKFLQEIGAARVIAFYGQMGAGKTTFISSVCRQLGVISQVNSPTFAIIYEYNTKSSESIFHFDFYRIKSQREAIETGALEYFSSGNFCFIEWPEMIEDLLPDEVLKVQIVENPDNKRVIRF